MRLGPGLDLTPTGLDVRSKPTADVWQEVGSKLVAMRTASAWAIGDWVSLGEQWGDASTPPLYVHSWDRACL